MLKLLSQIMATILAVGISFLAAYIIYLFSMKSDAQSKIEKEGYIISGILEKHSSQLFFAFSDVGRKILFPYLKKNPESTKLDLVDLALKDLSELIYSNRREQVNQTFSNYVDDNMPYAGRFYVFALDQYIQALFPPGMRKKGIGYSYPYHYNKTEDQSKWLFPYGPNGMEQWLKEFERIKSAVNMSKLMLRFYRWDLNEYSKQNQDKSYINRNNYQQWINESLKDIDSIEVPVRRIYSLSKIMEFYTLEKRLPNLKITSVFFILTFFCGVFIPLFLEGLGLVENINIPLNISILFITLLFTFFAGYYLFKDILPHKETIQIKVTLTELRENLDNIRMEIDQSMVVRYEYINSLRKGVYKDNIKSDYKEKLDSLSSKLSIYNNSIHNINEIIKTKIYGDKMLSSRIIKEGQGGNYVGIANILLNDDIEKYFRKNMIWVINLGADGFSPTECRIQVPNENDTYIEFINKVKEMKTEV